MTSPMQTDVVRALLESKGLGVRREVTLGQGLWKGIRADFVVDGIPDYPDGLAVECKWQNATGSAEEKIAYLVLNILRHYPIPCVIVCSGPELERAREWAQGEIDDERLVDALSTDEFIAWVSRL